MKKLLLSLALIAACVAANAGCELSPSGASAKCTDGSGNAYTVQSNGTTVSVQGSNPTTGSSWSNNYQTDGTTTYDRGMRDEKGISDDKSWDKTIRTTPGGTTYSGTNSKGLPFQRTCPTHGCN